jgi:acetyltransferase-like isoleucine patch superfamily enzyme
MLPFSKYSYGEPIILFESSEAKLYVGNFCSIADNVKIFLGGDHNINWITTYPFGHINKKTFNSFNGIGHPTTKGDVIIGNDVYIGSNATIMSGVKIGDGAIISVNSHVVKDVEPYSLVEGNPAKHIKYRFTKEQIDQLLKIKWWFWPDEQINKFVPLLCSKNIDNFIQTYNNNNIDEYLKSNNLFIIPSKTTNELNNIILLVIIFVIILLIILFVHIYRKKTNIINTV